MTVSDVGCQKKVAELESGKDRAATVASMATGGNVPMGGDTDAGGGGRGRRGLRRRKGKPMQEKILILLMTVKIVTTAPHRCVCIHIYMTDEMYARVSARNRMPSTFSRLDIFFCFFNLLTYNVGCSIYSIGCFILPLLLSLPPVGWWRPVCGGTAKHN